MNSVLLFLLFAATTVRRPVGFSFLFVFAWCLGLEKTKTKIGKEKNVLLVLSKICDECCCKAETKSARKLILTKKKGLQLRFPSHYAL